MAASPQMILGEYQRTVDERYRVSIPNELVEALSAASAECVLAKERPGCLSLWNKETWQEKLDQGVELIRLKMQQSKLDSRLPDLQRLGRLLSTRHKPVELAGRGRLLIPEGFREFLGVEPGGDVLIVGAAVCIEVWRPATWVAFVGEEMPEFRTLFDSLAT